MARYAVKDAPLNMESKDKNQTEAETKPSLNPAAKSRKCLMCSTAFDSDWSGERICRKCKSSSTWRSA